MKPDTTALAAEDARLIADAAREANWKRWGPYLSERQWGTVREDYSAGGDAWDHFPHDHARSRAYRWGEDGLLGICDRQARLCFAVALWNGRDPILKERLFGLTGPQGNHGEDVKEAYFYLDATPTFSYAKALYKYPQAEFPYAALLAENGQRSRLEPEFELADTGVFDEGRYFDVQVEYAKGGPEDILICITVSNRSAEDASLCLLPTLWCRNVWSWGRTNEEHGPRPVLRASGTDVLVSHEHLGQYRLAVGPGPDGTPAELMFTDNSTNAERLFGEANTTRYVKDAFHEYVIGGRSDAIDPSRSGTKAAALHRLSVPGGGSVTVELPLSADTESPSAPLGAPFLRTLDQRRREADAFHASRVPAGLDEEEQAIARQAYAGLIWSKQFYHYIVPDWIEGDPTQPKPPAERAAGRNHEWSHLYNRDVISMPDKWEYPWYAAWDLAFHMIPFARIDGDFARKQLELVLREWYMHPNGQMPAYEWALGDVNPPVHAWACWRVYKKSGPSGQRDVDFLKRTFTKLLLNFTWWVNRKDRGGNHLFSGGFLGLDNIGVFDRSAPLPGGGHLEQADGTAWMAFYCGTMLSIALELATHDASYEDMASKFFEHYVAIVDAMNRLGGTGLWDEADGFYYDRLVIEDRVVPLRVRSLVGVIPLLAVEVLEEHVVDRLPSFKKRMDWFLRNRGDLAGHMGFLDSDAGHTHRLLSIPSEERLRRVLAYVLDEGEFLSPHGVRSLSRVHASHPFEIELEGRRHRVDYAPAESDSAFFGGNSNWRGPVWFPINFLLVEALERYHRYYGEHFKVEMPTGSGNLVTLAEVSAELARRLTSLFVRDEDGRRPCHGDDERFRTDPHWRDHLLFHEYFDGDTGRGLGAGHQTGWTGLVATLLEMVAAVRTDPSGTSGHAQHGQPAP